MADKYGPDRPLGQMAAPLFMQVPWEASPCYSGLIALITQEELSMTTPSDAFY